MIKILFVCLGNICRSPLAHGVMKHYLETDPTLKERFFVDSAGTSVKYENQDPDIRVQKIAKENGILLDSKSRQLQKEDLANFDYIFVMDQSNYENVKSLDVDNLYQHKIQLLSNFFSEKKGSEIRDPYYKQNDAFLEVFYIIKNCCQNFLAYLHSKYGSKS